MLDYVILINLEDSVCYALARRLRAEHFFCRILPAAATADDILREDPRGVILATGCTGDPLRLPQMMDYLQMGLPMLCLGDAALTLCQTVGGELSGEAGSGIFSVTFDQGDSLFQGVEDGDHLMPLCRTMSFSADQGDICATANGGTVGIHVRQRSVWGFSFPPERNDPATVQLLLNFTQDKCGCTACWHSQSFIEKTMASIISAADGGDVCCALSGGVSSGVCAMLGHRALTQHALGQRLHCIFVDTGLLREGEADMVMEIYQGQMGLYVHRVDARAEFFLALRNCADPTEKERIIQDLLQEILWREAQALDAKALLRSANYITPPVPADTDARPAGMVVLDPILELFKDEIRHLGDLLGLPPILTSSQPFPYSGLACRIMADVDAERLDILRTADAIFRSEVEEAGLQKRLWQYYAALSVSPIPHGGLIVILRAVQTAEVGSGMPARIPSDLLERVTADVMRQCPDVKRVFYDCTPSESFNRLSV